MASQTWPAPADVVGLMEEVKEQNHPRLELAKVALAFVDAKAFLKGRFNWGKARKFTPQAKLWHAKDKKYDFEITLPADGWYQVLQGVQKEAWLDLHLSRFRPEMKPVMVEVNGKQKPVKDDFGRIEYTNDMKIDEKTGEPIWCVDPLDLHVFSDNAARYGVWCQDLQDFEAALVESKSKERQSRFIPNADVVFTPHLPPVEDEEMPYEYMKKLGMGMD